MFKTSVRDWWKRNVSVNQSFLLLIFFTALAVRVGYLVKSGGFTATSDTEVFLHTCSSLGSGPLLGQRNGVVGAQYAGFLLFFCPFVRVLGLTIWGYFLVLLSAVTPILVYFTGRELFDSDVGLFAAFLQIWFYDAFRWTQKLMTEPVFVFALALAFWRVSVYARTKSRRDLVLTSLVIGWMAVVRPFGVPIALTGGSLYLFAQYRTFLTDRVITPVVLLLSTLWSLFALGLSISYPNFLTRFWRNGYVFWRGEARPGVLLPGTIEPRTYVSGVPSVINEAIHVMVLMVARFVAFFHPVNYFWDPTHTIHFVYGLFYVPLLIASLLGMIATAKEKDLSFVVLSTPIIATVMLSAILFVERQFRYRGPLGPSLALFAAYFLVTRSHNARMTAT